MTKKDILDYFKDIDAMYNDCTKHDTLKRMLDKLQEPCNDAISRQAVLNEIYNLADKIIALPSVTPAEKVGYWRDTGSGQECSECGEIQYGYDSFRKYCANCGAKMQEDEDNG